MSAPRDKVAIGIAAGVGLAAAHMVAGVTTPPPGSEAGVPWPVHYLGVGPVVGLLYYFVIAATLERTAAWFATCALGAYVFAAWFALPMLHRPAGAVARFVAAPPSRGAAAREVWLSELIAAGRYGDAGLSPPMLAVQGSDVGNVVVRNAAGGTLPVSVAAVAADSAASGGWRGCSFTGYAGEGAQEWVELGPGESAVFELEPVCKEIFLDLAWHAEFRVGNETVPVDVAWWTTSALVAPHGREREHASGNTALPSSYDARAFYGAPGGGE